MRKGEVISVKNGQYNTQIQSVRIENKNFIIVNWAEKFMGLDYEGMAQVHSNSKNDITIICEKENDVLINKYNCVADMGQMEGTYIMEMNLFAHVINMCESVSKNCIRKYISNNLDIVKVGIIVNKK